MPRLFVLADALHHGSMQAWALGATDTICAAVRRAGHPAAHPRRVSGRQFLRRDRSRQGAEPRRRGGAWRHGQDLREAAGRRAAEIRATSSQAENKILKAIKHSSLREWLTTVGCHHTDSYRHCLFVTGFAVAFAQHLGMREDDQRRLARAALLHDVGKAFVPVAILDKPDALTPEEMDEMRQHPRRGYDALAAQGGFPPEMLDVVLHHHEFLDGTGYPDGL